jgi:hypothetical protein
LGLPQVLCPRCARLVRSTRQAGRRCGQVVQSRKPETVKASTSKKREAKKKRTRQRQAARKLSWPRNTRKATTRAKRGPWLESFLPIQTARPSSALALGGHSVPEAVRKDHDWSVFLQLIPPVTRNHSLRGLPTSFLRPSSCCAQLRSLGLPSSRLAFSRQHLSAQPPGYQPNCSIPPLPSTHCCVPGFWAAILHHPWTCLATSIYPGSTTVDKRC